MNYIKLSTRIRIARQRAQLSQKALASRIGVSRGAVANWECPQGASPATSRLEVIAHAAGVCFEWLATGRGPVAYRNDPDDIPAVEAELVYDPDEMRLLAAFRAAGRQMQRLLLNMVEAQSASGGQGRA
ncbi:helix-turn-helix transcriptional regulator [Pseudoxanthomonas koreensis]|uniref:helix-turn-helix transcriptional regulator n=1 Tax=Pseudoxanthomonas koreensis TaxID=266061 RepID=UPI0035A5905A